MVCPSLLLATAARRILRHEHHRLLGSLYGRDRDDGAGRSCDVRRAFAGLSAAVSLPRAIPRGSAATTRWSSESIERARADVSEFRADDVIASRVARARDVQAISTLELLRDLLPPLATSIDHVFVVNSAQIAYGTLNVNETLALAARQAAALAAVVAQRRRAVGVRRHGHWDRRSNGGRAGRSPTVAPSGTGCPHRT